MDSSLITKGTRVVHIVAEAFGWEKEAQKGVVTRIEGNEVEVSFDNGETGWRNMRYLRIDDPNAEESDGARCRRIADELIADIEDILSQFEEDHYSPFIPGERRVKKTADVMLDVFYVGGYWTLIMGYLELKIYVDDDFRNRLEIGKHGKVKEFDLNGNWRRELYQFLLTPIYYE